MHFKDARSLTIQTTDDMLAILKTGNSIKDYHAGMRITVYNKMQKGYSYMLQEKPGTRLGFRPDLSPAQMLRLGVFEGKYLNDCLLEYPKEWFIAAIKKGKLSPQGADPSVNCFGVKSRLSIGEWKEYGWLPNAHGWASSRYPLLSDRINPDHRGWFEWYCRYWMGRRIPALDEVQIKRYHAFQRHVAQIRAHCAAGNQSCRPVQRQALLQWAHDPTL